MTDYNFVLLYFLVDEFKTRYYYFTFEIHK